MKITNYLTLCLALLLLLNCTSSDNDDDTGATIPEVENIKHLSGITGAEYDNIDLLYSDNNKVLKGYVWSSRKRFQVEYNGNGKVSKVITESNSFNGFDFDLTDCNDCPEYYYNYENGKVISIKEGTNDYLEYKYLDGKVIESKEYNDIGLNRLHMFEYDANDKITHKITTQYGSEIYTYSDALTFDDKVNPFYILWKETGLHFPSDTGSIYKNNLVFYPNNVIRVEEDGEIDFRVTMNYDNEGYPTFFNIDGEDSGVIGYIE